MFTALYLALFLVQTPLTPRDFFPTRPGTTWTYEDEMHGRKTTVVDRVLAEVKIGSRTAFPIESSGDGLKQTTYYALDGDAVLMLGADPKRPLEVPYPVLRVGERKVSWNFAGATPFLAELAPLALKGEAQLRGEREVLGRRVRVLEVVLDAIVGAGETSVRNRQVALYGQGLGLFELRETAHIASRRYTRVRKLTSFTLGPG